MPSHGSLTIDTADSSLEVDYGPSSGSMLILQLSPFPREFSDWLHSGEGVLPVQNFPVAALVSECRGEESQRLLWSPNIYAGGGRQSQFIKQETPPASASCLYQPSSTRKSPNCTRPTLDMDHHSSRCMTTDFMAELENDLKQPAVRAYFSSLARTQSIPMTNTKTSTTTSTSTTTTATTKSFTSMAHGSNVLSPNAANMNPLPKAKVAATSKAACVSRSSKPKAKYKPKSKPTKPVRQKTTVVAKAIATKATKKVVKPKPRCSYIAKIACPITIKTEIKAEPTMASEPTRSASSASPHGIMHRCTWDNCENVYSKSSHLKAHVRRHTGEKPFHCEWQDCQWRFSRSDELSRHVRSHTGFKPYGCKICSKSFSRSDHLKKHMVTHRGKGRRRQDQPTSTPPPPTAPLPPPPTTTTTITIQ